MVRDSRRGDKLGPLVTAQSRKVSPTKGVEAKQEKGTRLVTDRLELLKPN